MVVLTRAGQPIGLMNPVCAVPGVNTLDPTGVAAPVATSVTLPRSTLGSPIPLPTATPSGTSMPGGVGSQAAPAPATATSPPLPTATSLPIRRGLAPVVEKASPVPR